MIAMIAAIAELFFLSAIVAITWKPGLREYNKTSADASVHKKNSWELIINYHIQCEVFIGVVNTMEGIHLTSRPPYRRIFADVIV